MRRVLTDRDRRDRQRRHPPGCRRSGAAMGPERNPIDDGPARRALSKVQFRTVPTS
jgi:hypothetical protein